MEENNQNRPGFEQTDVNVIAVGKFAIGLVLVTILVMGLIVAVFNVLKTLEGGEAVSVDPTKVFPDPQLQKTPIPDLRAVRAAEDETLNSYGWVDQQKGVVRIPINQAMDLLVKKGLPVSPSAQTGAEGVSVPTESGLGPKMQRPGGPLGEGK
jgi:hypothetical protein